MGKIVERVLGSKNQRDLKALMPLVGRINELEARMIALHDADFPAATERFRGRLQTAKIWTNSRRKRSPWCAKRRGAGWANGSTTAS